MPNIYTYEEACGKIDHIKAEVGPVLNKIIPHCGDLIGDKSYGVSEYENDVQERNVSTCEWLATEARYWLNVFESDDAQTRKEREEKLAQYGNLYKEFLSPEIKGMEIYCRNGAYWDYHRLQGKFVLKMYKRLTRLDFISREILPWIVGKVCEYAAWTNVKRKLEGDEPATTSPTSIAKAKLNDRAKKYFSKAIKAGLMREEGEGYKWLEKPTNVSLAYFCEKIYNNKGSGQIPFKSVIEPLFGVKLLAQSLYNHRVVKSVPKWKKRIDGLFTT